MDFEALFARRQEAIAAQNAGHADQAVRIYHELLDYEGAEERIEGETPDALTLGEFFSVIHNNLGAIDLAAGRYKPARAAFRKALDLTPGNVEANTNLGMAHIFSRNPTAAIDPLKRAIEADPGYVKAYYALAKALNLTGQYEKALETLEDSIDKFPDLPEFHAERAEAMLRLSRLDEARQSAAETLRLDPQNADGLAVMGTIHWMSGELELAEEVYRRSLELRPGEPAVHTNRAVVLQKLKRFDEAVESYQRALEIDPTFVDAMGNLAYLYSSRELVPKAREVARRGLRQMPGEPFLLFVLARCDRLEGKLEAAQSQLEKLEPLLPEGRLMAEVLFELGKTHDAKGERESAARYIDRAIEIGRRLPTVVGRGLQDALENF